MASVDDDRPIESGNTRAWTASRVALISLLVVVVIVCAILSVWTTSYMVNDDATMSAFASGDYTGRPTAHLVYVSSVLGLFLSGLHRVAEGITWYALMLVGVVVCSAAGILAIAHARRAQLRQRGEIALLALLGIFIPIVLLRLTFTVVAMTLCLAGLLLIAAACRSSAHSRQLLLLGSCSMGVGSMVRFDSFVGVVAVFLPFIALIVAHLGLRRSLLSSCAIAGLLVVSAVTDRVINSPREWSSYLEFNDVRATLSGSIDFHRAMTNPDDPAVVETLKSIGWTVEDVQLFNSWFYYDPEVYSTDHLSKLSSLTGSAEYSVPYGESALLVLRSQRSLWLAAVSLGVLAAASRRWKPWAFMSVQLVWCMIVLSYTAATERFPERVSIPMYFGVGLVLILGVPLLLKDRDILVEQPHVVRRRPWEVLTIAVCLMLGFQLVTDGYSPWQISRENRVKNAIYDDQLSVMRQADPAGRFLCLGATLTMEGTDALATTSGYQGNEVLCTGWPMFSPSFEQRRANLGIDERILDTLTTDPHVYLVLVPGLIPTFESLYMRYEGLEVTLEEVAQLANGAIVAQVRIVEPSSQSDG